MKKKILKITLSVVLILILAVGLGLQLAKENKKFFFGQIKKGARSSELTPCSP